MSRGGVGLGGEPVEADEDADEGGEAGGGEREALEGAPVAVDKGGEGGDGVGED